MRSSRLFLGIAAAVSLAQSVALSAAARAEDSPGCAVPAAEASGQAHRLARQVGDAVGNLNYGVMLQVGNDNRMYSGWRRALGLKEADDSGYTHNVQLIGHGELKGTRGYHLFGEAGTRLYTRALREDAEIGRCRFLTQTPEAFDKCRELRHEYFVNHNRLGLGVGKLRSDGVYWNAVAGLDQLDGEHQDRVYNGVKQQRVMHPIVGMPDIVTVPDAGKNRNGAYARALAGYQAGTLRLARGRVSLSGFGQARAEASTLGSVSAGVEARAQLVLAGKRGRAALKLESGMRTDVSQDGVETWQSNGAYLLAGPVTFGYMDDNSIDAMTSGANNVSGFNDRRSYRKGGGYDSIGTFFLGFSGKLQSRWWE